MIFDYDGERLAWTFNLNHIASTSLEYEVKRSLVKQLTSSHGCRIYNRLGILYTAIPAGPWGDRFSDYSATEK
jgi:hypothetical protein